MTEIAEVCQGLATLATLAIYPVAGQASIIGFDVEIGTGWPDSADLTAAIKAGHGFIAVYPIDGERDTTRFETVDTDVPRIPPGIIAKTTVGNIVTFAGVANSNDVIGLTVNEVHYTFKLNAGDLPTVIANEIVAAVPMSSSSNGSVTFQYMPTVVVSTNGESFTNQGNTERRVQFTVWAVDAVARDKIGKALEMAIRTQSFFYVGDAYEAVRLWYDRSMFDDKPQDSGGYKRTIIVKVDYAFLVFSAASAILFPVANTTVRT